MKVNGGALNSPSSLSLHPAGTSQIVFSAIRLVDNPLSPSRLRFFDLIVKRDVRRAPARLYFGPVHRPVTSHLEHHAR